MSKFIFSEFFFQSILPCGKVSGYPKLLISRFSNEKKNQRGINFLKKLEFHDSLLNFHVMSKFNISIQFEIAKILTRY